MKNESKDKKYFQNLNMTSDDIIHMVCKDYIETLKMILVTNSYMIFKEKIHWFKSMSKSRIKEVSIKDSLIDFINVLKEVIYDKCGRVLQLEKVFENMIIIINEVFSDE